jgi:branched-subunit amino acid aminotransferase/4-amino-4-deoxychorismate lyase
LASAERGAAAAPAPAWLDGRLVEARAPGVPPDDAALQSGRGCYTTARAVRGVAHHAERHVRRLVRDAARVGVGALDAGACREALAALARAAFGDSEGVVRLQASASAGGPPRLIGTVRALGPEPAVWTAVVAPFPHAGPSPWSAAKTTNHLRFAWAAELARAAGADEALLLDTARRLVEGARSSLVVVRADGSLVTPPLARGAQAGVARELLLERVEALREADVAPGTLAAARELVAVNAVRGARPVIRVGDRPVGAGAPGPWSERLARALQPE